MKIGLVKYKYEVGHDPQDYLNFVESTAQKLQKGMLIGPDYALAKFKGVHDIYDTAKISKRICEISKQYPNLCLAVGTMPIEIEKNKMAHLAPVFIDGIGIAFRKQTSQGENELAAKNGMTYLRGESKPNTFNFSGKKAWLHICGDRDRKPESRCDDADLELILSHDTNAGFHMTVNTPQNPRHIILSDSYHPKAQILRFKSPNDSTFLKSKEQIISGKYGAEIFEIK